MRYIEYELELLPSPPRLSVSVKVLSGSGVGYGKCEDLSNLESKVQGQHGMDR